MSLITIARALTGELVHNGAPDIRGAAGDDDARVGKSQIHGGLPGPGLVWPTHWFNLD